jgi:ribonuclease P protein component
MKNEGRLKKSKEFGYVYKRGKSYADRFLIMYIVPNNSQSNKVGFSVSKKVGNSVVRHHITRLIRESFRLHEDMIETDLDIVVVARAAAKEQDYKSIESAYLHLCGLHNILKKESK